MRSGYITEAVSLFNVKVNFQPTEHRYLGMPLRTNFSSRQPGIWELVREESLFSIDPRNNNIALNMDMVPEVTESHYRIKEAMAYAESEAARRHGVCGDAERELVEDFPEETRDEKKVQRPKRNRKEAR